MVACVVPQSFDLVIPDCSSKILIGQSGWQPSNVLKKREAVPSSEISADGLPEPKGDVTGSERSWVLPEPPERIVPDCVSSM